MPFFRSSTGGGITAGSWLCDHGSPGNALLNIDALDGINDPWRWTAAYGAWIGPAYEVTWVEGDTVPLLEGLPSGAFRVEVWIGEFEAFTDASFETATPSFTGGLWSRINLDPAAEGGSYSTPYTLALVDAGLNVTALSNDQVFVIPPHSEVAFDVGVKIRVWGGNVVGGVTVTEGAGVTLTGESAIVDTLNDLIVLEQTAEDVWTGVPSSDLDGQLVSDYQHTPTEPLVAEADGSGVVFLVQYETAYAHTVVPDVDLDVRDLIGDVVAGDVYEWPVGAEPVGEDGQMYLDLDTLDLYGPRSGGWTKIATLPAP